MLYFNHLKQEPFTPNYRSITLITVTSRWHCTQTAHAMATIVKLSSGNYRVQVRRKGQYASKTFRRKADAYAWALEAERRSDQGRAIKAPKITGFNSDGTVLWRITTPGTGAIHPIFLWAFIATEKTWQDPVAV